MKMNKGLIITLISININWTKFHHLSYLHYIHSAKLKIFITINSIITKKLILHIIITFWYQKIYKLVRRK